MLELLLFTLKLNFHIESTEDSQLPRILNDYEIKLDEAFHIYHCICNRDVEMMEWLLSRHIDKLSDMREYHNDKTSKDTIDKLVAEQTLIIKAIEIISN